MKNLILISLVVAGLSACGEDSETPENNAQNNTTQATNNETVAETNNQTTTDPNNNNSNNETTANTNQQTSGLDEPYVSTFRWIKRKNDDCSFSGCDEGYDLATVTRTISNFDGRIASINEDADWDSWESIALNQDVMDKAVDGWTCPEKAPEGEFTYQLEIRIQDGGSNLYRPDVTGCYEAQEADLMQIEAELERLSEKYLP